MHHTKFQQIKICIVIFGFIDFTRSFVLNGTASAIITEPDNHLTEDLNATCKSGFLTGRCTYSLNCRLSGGFAKDVCHFKNGGFGVCCLERSTVSVVEQDNKDCGIIKTGNKYAPRIVNGTEGTYGQFPWTVSIRLHIALSESEIFSQHFCGGSLLNRNWVISGAHCFSTGELDMDYLVLRFGEHKEPDINEEFEVYPYTERKIAKSVVHPNFRIKDYYSDIILLKLQEPIDFKENIQPICLPGNKDQLEGKTGTVSGWGLLEEEGELPDVIKSTSFPIIENYECEKIFLRGKISENIADMQNVFLCAGYEDGGTDACTGDSGGPLQVQGDDGRQFLAGIVSWGYGCSRPYKPGVYTRVSQFMPWILDTVKNN